MKKYINPEMKVVNLKTRRQLLAGSGVGPATPPTVKSAPKYYDWEDEEFDE